MSIKFFKFSCGLSALVLSAGMMAACGSSDDDPPAGSGGSGGEPGNGEAGSGGDPSGTGGSGTGGSGTGGSGTGGAPPTGGVECGGETCSDVDVMGLLELPGCCSENTRCGVDLALAAAFLEVPSGCTELNQPGELDDSCPDMPYETPIMNFDLDGCCLPSGECGVVANIVVANFGCVDPNDFGEEGELQSCDPGGDPPDAGPDANGDEEDAGADANGNGNGDEDGGADAGDAG